MSKNIRPRTELAPGAVNPSISEAVGTVNEQSTSRRDDDVARIAYQYWLERGSPQGSPEEDWYRAERDMTKQKNLRVAG